MANEYTASVTFRFVKSLVSVSATPRTQKTVSGSLGADVTQIIGTTYEALVFGDIGTNPGVFMLQNLDVTNYVEISSDGGATYCMRLSPGSTSVGGGLALVPNNSLTTWGARSGAGSPIISVRAVSV